MKCNASSNLLPNLLLYQWIMFKNFLFQSVCVALEREREKNRDVGLNFKTLYLNMSLLRREKRNISQYTGISVFLEKALGLR